MLGKILGVLDFLPGYKSNTGALVLVLTTILQVCGVDSSMIELVKKLSEALLVYGVALKNVRK